MDAPTPAWLRERVPQAGGRKGHHERRRRYIEGLSVVKDGQNGLDGLFRVAGARAADAVARGPALDGADLVDLQPRS